MRNMSWLLICVLGACFATSYSIGQDVNSFYGINGVSLFHLKSDPKKWEKADNRLDAADWLGTRWHRCDFWWADIEPEQGKFDFSYTDQVVEAFLSNNRNLMPILCYNSAWQPDASPVSDEEQQLFARYVFTIVKRYKDRITDWEIWNEPNITPFWVPDPNPEAYASLLKLSYESARKANPDCNIIGFCTAGADYPFIERVYELGGARYCDTFSYHHYNSEKDESILEEEICNIKLIMKRFGDADKPIWITEMGLNTGLIDAAGIKPSTEGEQADWLLKKMLTALSTRFVERIFWFTIDDWAPEREIGEHWGVFDYHLLPKPAGYAYRTLIERTSGKEYIGKINLSPTAVCFMFKDNASITGVIWSSRIREKVYIYPEKKELKLYTMYGESSELKVKEKSTELEIMQQPFYIEGLDASYLLPAAIQTSDTLHALLPGQKKEIIVLVNNVTGKTRECSLSAAMEDCSIEIENPTRKIRNGNSEQFKISIAVKPEAETGWKRLKIRTPDKDLPALKNVYTVVPIKIIEPVKSEIIMSAEDDVISLKGRLKNLSDVILEGRIHWEILPEGVVERAPEQIKKLEPNAVKESGSHLRAGYGERSICLSAGFDICGDCKFRTQKNIAGAPYMDKVDLVIDGKLDDWGDVVTIALDSADHLISGTHRDEWAPPDSSAIIKIAGDKNNLYIAAQVRDDVPGINSHEGSQLWRGDGLEVYLGVAGPTTHYWYSEQEYQIGLSTGYKDIPPHAWLWQVGRIDRAFETAKVASEISDSGYVIEARIPLRELGIEDLKAPALVGFDIALNDNDDPESEDKDTVLMWNGTDMNWRDPSNWGALMLLTTP